MKSILLCENPLVKHENSTKNLKENSKDEQLEGTVKLNGTADDKISESQVPDCKYENNENFLQNGNKSTTENPSVVEVSKNGECKTAGELNSSEREKCAGDDGKSTVVTMETSNSSNDQSENCLMGAKNSCDDISRNLNDNSKVRNSSIENSVSEEKNQPILSVKLDPSDEVGDEVNEILIIDDNERITEKAAINPTSKNEENGFLSVTKPKKKVEENPLSDEIFDVDSNKENLKDEKTNSAEDLPKDGEEGSDCKIQVEKVQSVSSQDSDFVWLSGDPEKPQEIEATQEKELEEADDVYTCSEELTKSLGDDCQALMVIENVNSVHLEGELQMEVEEADQEIDLNEEENKNEQAEWDESSAESESKKAKEKCYEPVMCLTVAKKRSKTEEKNQDLGAKKIKLLANKNFENSEGKLRVESFTGVDVGDLTKVAETSFKAEATREKGTDKEKVDNTQDLENQSETAAPTSSFLASFRESLKNLTKSDLEELIVQKLCEVITERSTVGELRRKAQALEQDQERWKVKVQTLSKQMKEMEMVMKKYMSEVQKQLKEGTNHVVASPLRVTRSVGLQVSFLTNPNRGPKANVSQPASPCQAQTVNTRSSKGSPKPPLQYTSVTQNLRSKSMPAPSKTSPLQKASVTQQRRHSVALNSTPPNRPVITGSVTITPNRLIQAVVSGPRPAYRPVTNTAQQQQQQIPQQSQQLQQQQHGSKVIDLTEDDDQRTNSAGKQNTPTRVVSHLPQSGAPSSNRYTYIVPATSTSTGSGGTQNRQVLIATPAIQTPQQNRQIMCSMPPLLFKGGNQVQPTSQPQAISQNNNRVILPKILRHPAPLPQAPIRNWANMKQLPPRPALKISKVQSGIVLSWNMVLGPEHAPIRSYQLYAYQESSSPPTTSLWKKVGDVKALPLPMACTLTQFMSGHKYHFAVRAVDLHSRIGPFSFPGTIVLDKNR